MVESIFFQISILLGITLVVSLLINVLRQPLIISYLITGICAGPLVLNLINPASDLWHFFSRLGVILLLFVVGLSLNFGYLRKIGKVAIITGVGQVIFTGLIGVGLLKALNFSWWSAAALAVATTFSSTIIITKLLGDKKQLDSLYGRYTVGLLLVQDILAIVGVMLITSYAGGAGDWLSLIAILALKGTVLVVFVYLLARFVLPLILNHVARSSEFLFLFSLSWCFGVTFAVSLLGFSLEVGAILAGLALGSSVYQPEIAARIKPLRDFFLIIFFILLGAEMNLAYASTALVPALVLSAFVIIGNPIILFFLYRVLRFTRRNSFLASLTAAQVSEFGFVLLFLGREFGYVSSSDVTIFTIVALVTIFISSYLITYGERLFKLFEPVTKLFGPDRQIQDEPEKVKHDIWVVGYHRIGWKIVEMLKTKNTNFAVIDFNPEVIADLRLKKIPAYFGDISDVEFLSALALEESDMVISTVPQAEEQLTMLKFLRHHAQGKDRPAIIVNSPEAKYRHWLYAAGADYVMTPHLLGGELITGMIKNKKVNRAALREARAEQEKEVDAGMPIDNL